MQTYWIGVAGLSGAGKSTFLQHAAEFITEHDPHEPHIIAPAQPAAVSTLPRPVTVGGIRIDTHTQVCLYEVPAAHPAENVPHLLPLDDYLGTVIVLDSTSHRTIRDASQRAADLAAHAATPYVFAANKQDDEYALPVQDLRILLQHLDGHLLPVVPCVATQRPAVQRVLLSFLELVRDDYDDGIAW